MKKLNLWGVGALVALGFIAYLLVSQSSWAVDGDSRRIHFDATNFAEPGDSLFDELSDRPGHDRVQDRTPDNNPDAVEDGAPDCVGNLSGAGSGGFPRGRDGGDCENSYEGHADSGDGIPEDQPGDFGTGNFGLNADGGPVQDGVPDATRYMKINRALESTGNNGSGTGYTRDYSPDWINSDTYLAKVGKKTSVGDDTPDGGRPNASYQWPGIPVGEGGTDIRPHDFFNDSLTSGRDGLRYAYGPGDKKNDSSPDMGGLGTSVGGGGGGGGCSLVAGQSADPASGLAYLLVLLTPAAVVVIRRIVRRK